MSVYAAYRVAHSRGLFFDMGLVRVLGAGYGRRLARCCFACRNNLLDFVCVCGNMSPQSHIEADFKRRLNRGC